MVIAVPAQSDLHRRFCDSVKARRLSLSLTQREVAERLGIAPPSYAAIEAGRKVPRLDVIERVAIALECDASALLSRKKLSA